LVNALKSHKICQSISPGALSDNYLNIIGHKIPILETIFVADRSHA